MNLTFTTHAEKRMAERKITRFQVEQTLLTGRTTERRMNAGHENVCLTREKLFGAIRVRVIVTAPNLVVTVTH